MLHNNTKSEFRVSAFVWLSIEGIEEYITIHHSQPVYIIVIFKYICIFVWEVSIFTFSPMTSSFNLLKLAEHAIQWSS